MNLRDNLLAGKAKIAVVGVGYIGLSTCMAYAQEGVKVVAYDIDEKKVSQYKKGVCPLPKLEEWLQARLKDYLHMIHFTCDKNDLQDKSIVAYFVAVNTEKKGIPWYGAFHSVMKMLKETVEAGKNSTAKPLVIVESTIKPYTLRDYVSHGYHLVCAPRRDWFIGPEKNLKNLLRVFGCDKPSTRPLAEQVLGIVCKNLQEASSLETAELVKAVENALQHTKMIFASELAFAYPDLDIVEVMRLSGGHWRLGGIEQRWFRPGLGCGGYCIPVSGSYVKEGALNPEFLTIVESTQRANVRIGKEFVDAYSDAENVAILGLSYKEDVKIPVLSSCITLANSFLQKGVKVKIFDPYYTKEEIKKIVSDKVEPIEDFSDIAECDLIVVLSPHKAIRNKDFETLRKCIHSIVIDDTGCWERYRRQFREAGIEYHRVGDEGWLPLQPREAVTLEVVKELQIQKAPATV